MDLHLPAAGVGQPNRLGELTRLPFRVPKGTLVVGAHPLVGGQHRRGSGLDHPVGERLDDPGRNPRIIAVGESQALVFDQAAFPVRHREPRFHPQPEADTRHRATGGAERLVDLELLGGRARFLDAGQAVLVGEPDRPGQAFDVLCERRPRDRPIDEFHRRLLEDPRGMPPGIALDLAARRVGRLVRNAEAGEGGRVHPGGVAVVGLDRDRSVGHHPVEEVAVRHPAREHGVEPAASEQPVPVGMTPGKLDDPPKNAGHRGFGRELKVLQIAGTVQEVDVGVIEAGQDQAPAGVEDGRSGAGQRPNLQV